MEPKKPLYRSTATYRMEDGSMLCDLVELATKYRNVGGVPERLGWMKACEVALLADAFLHLHARYESDKKPAGKKRQPT